MAAKTDLLKQDIMILKDICQKVEANQIKEPEKSLEVLGKWVREQSLFRLGQLNVSTYCS